LVLLGSRQRAHSYSSLATVNVAVSQIPLADHIKILGVTLDKNLSMNNHVNAVCKSIHYHICALRHIHSSISECGDAFPIEGVLVATYLLSVEALPHCRCGVANKSFMV